jgi:hypothetical protein
VKNFPVNRLGSTWFVGFPWGKSAMERNKNKFQFESSRGVVPKKQGGQRLKTSRGLSMSKNSGLMPLYQKLLNLPLGELDEEIARCQMRRRISTAASLRKKFDNRLRKLKVIREKISKQISN